ncbi:ADP-ribosylglycohydrolase family protein [Aspergillus lucknowensis]|uniref:ADP-ribosylglycohydrolase-domain-containing protein n=1 Tax=Aspergillus lucknowensis TaxID=176173 RepID=A0ABR4LHJ9_9EURO
MDRPRNLKFFDASPVSRDAVLDRLRGTIVGAALGDAIGLYTEFLSKSMCRTAYPEGKFQLVAPATRFLSDGHRLKFAQTGWTDDTDHSLLIVLSYLHGNGHLDPVDFAHRLQFWVEQGLRCLDRLPLGLGRTVGAVVCHPSFLTDPTATAYENWNKLNRNPAPNGSLMRTHPLGVICFDETVEETFRVATDFSRVTHADPRCIVSCCVATGLVRGLLRSEVLAEKDIDQMIESSLSWVGGWISAQNASSADTSKPRYPALDHEEFYKHVRAATLEDLQLDDSMKMGYVYKTLGAGVLLLRRALRRLDNADELQHAGGLFEELITELIMQGGDADTNATVAGSFLGALLGYNTQPGKWKDGLMHGGWLLRKCDALAAVVGIYAFDQPYDGRADPDTGLEGGKPRLTKEELMQREKGFMERYLTNLKRDADKRATKSSGWLGKLFGR